MPLFGIDVSTLNGDLNFLAVKYAGVRFAMVKASQGHSLYSGNAYLFEDRRFARNVLGFHKVGIPVGAYHFFTASTLDEAYREADFFIKTVAPYRDKISLYLACDAEAYANNPYIYKLDKAQLTSLINAFCDRVSAAGFHACHYTNTDHIRNRIDLDKIPHPVWQAHYGKSSNGTPPPDAGTKLAVHQYTDSGQLPGVTGQFDLNFGYAPLARLIIKSRTTLEDKTLDYIEKYKTGGNILTRLADKIVARDFHAISNTTHEKLVSHIRVQCALTADEAAYLNSYRWAEDLFKKLYSAMLP